MKLNYPESIPLRYLNYPTEIDIRLGAIAASYVPGTSLGTKMTLLQTPKSLVPQGEYVAGSPLPEYRCVYSDTGEDDDFNIKLSFDGYMSFFYFGHSDNGKDVVFDEYYTLYLYKSIIVETKNGGWVENWDEWEFETLIPTNVDLSAYNPSGIKYGYIEFGALDGDGRIVVNGKYYNISDGRSITAISTTGHIFTIYFINGTYFITA